MLSFDFQLAWSCKENGTQWHLPFFALWCLLIDSFMYSTNLYWVPTYEVPGSILGTVDTAENKTSPRPQEVYSLVWGLGGAPHILEPFRKAGKSFLPSSQNFDIARLRFQKRNGNGGCREIWREIIYFSGIATGCSQVALEKMSWQVLLLVLPVWFFSLPLESSGCVHLCCAVELLWNW